MAPTKLNLQPGSAFGQLVVVGREGLVGRYHGYRCRCSCGNEVVVRSSHLMDGTTVSCGCYRKQRMQQMSYKHGHAGEDNSTMSSEYRSWLAMKNRCYYESNPRYYLYGGRGIKVCSTWLHDFKQFLTDMGPKPTPRHTIDREDPDGDYEPSNCRWATYKEQNQRRRKKCGS